MKQEPDKNKTPKVRQKPTKRRGATQLNLTRGTAAGDSVRFVRNPQARGNELERRKGKRFRAGTSTELAKQIDFEKVLTELSARFVNVPSGEVDHEIEDAQRRVCECLGLDLAGLWQFLPEDPLSLVMTLCVFAPMMYVRAKKEDSLLLETFGEEFREYRNRTGMFFPRVWR